MTERRETTLGNVLTLQRGFDITKREQRPGRVPVVSSSGVSSYHDEPRVEAPGVVVGRKGSLGTVFFLEEPFWPHDTTLWVKDFKGNDPYLCYLLLRTLPLAELDAGSSNPTLNRTHAHTLGVLLPHGSWRPRNGRRRSTRRGRGGSFSRRWRSGAGSARAAPPRPAGVEPE